MNLKLIRDKTWSEAVTGRLYANEVFECYVLEPIEHLIPEGIYPVTWEYSPRFSRHTLRLHDVPDREGILIHAGNVAGDSEGCLLVGQERAKNFVAHSRAALAKLEALVRTALKVETVTLEITKDYSE